jgi:hypothetical protein
MVPGCSKVEEDPAGDSGSWGTACRNGRDRLGYPLLDDGTAGGNGRAPASIPSVSGIDPPRRVVLPAQANPNIGTGEQEVDRSAVGSPSQATKLVRFARCFAGSDPNLAQVILARGVREDHPRGTRAEGAAWTKTDGAEEKIGSDPFPWDCKVLLRAIPRFDPSRATPPDAALRRCRMGFAASPALHLAALPSL